MGLEYNLEIAFDDPVQRELAPRISCRQYVNDNCNKATLIKREEFDKHARKKEFSDGPYTEGFGDDAGQPYNPDRQAFGTLKSGLVVYCELSDAFQEKTKKLFERLGI